MVGTYKGSCSLPHPLCTCMKCLCTFSFNAPRMSTQRYLDMSPPSVFLLLPTDMVCVVEQVERCPAGVSSVSLFRSLREELLCPRIFFCSDECSNCRQFNFTLFLFTSNAFIYFISLFLLEFHQVVFTMTFKPRVSFFSSFSFSLFPFSFAEEQFTDSSQYIQVHCTLSVHLLTHRQVHSITIVVVANLLYFQQPL